MSIDVRSGSHLGGGAIPVSVFIRAANRSKWTNEQQRELTRQLPYGCGKRREFYNHPSKDLNNPPEKERTSATPLFGLAGLTSCGILFA
jgi:hypothetical protein